MLKLVLHKAFTSLLAFLVLFSTFSLTVEKHFCGSNLVDVAVFTSVKKCGDYIEKSSSNKSELTKKSCCKDEFQVFSGQNQLDIKSPLDISAFNKQFVAAFLVTYSNLYKSLPKITIPNLYYNTPDLVIDIQVIDQVFLI
jgi:hypothetical protein